MTATVLDIQNDDIIVLGGDGQVYKIKRNPGDSVGQTIEFSAEQARAVNRMRKFWNFTTNYLTLLILILLGSMILLFSAISPRDAINQTDGDARGSHDLKVDDDSGWPNIYRG